MSYTKGEWKRAPKAIMLDRGAYYKCRVHSDSKEDPVMPGAGYGLTYEKAMDNAQLIAAAPDMLEALEQAQAAMGNIVRDYPSDNDDYDELQEAYETVKQAIANAKGGQS